MLNLSKLEKRCCQLTVKYMIFKPEHFKGCGQYLVRNDKPEDTYEDYGFVSTILYKVGWHHGTNFINRPKSNVITLTSMADGWVHSGDYTTGEYRQWDTKEIFCDYLNNLDETQKMRFATKKEVLSVILWENYRYADSVKKEKFITWDKVLQLEESIGFLSNYTNKDNEIVIVRTDDGEIDSEKTTHLQNIANANKRRLELLNKY